MKQIEQRLQALEATQPVSGNAATAAAVARLVDSGDLVFASGCFTAGNNTSDRMNTLANLLNVAHERWERDQQ